MVKPKQKRVHGGPGKKQQNQGCPTIMPSNEEDWIVVKKQKVTILIPPLPGKVQSTMPTLGEGELQEKLRNLDTRSPRKADSQVQLPSEDPALKQSVHEVEKSISLSPDQAIHPPNIVDPSELPNLTIQKPSGLHHRIGSDNSHLHSFREGKGIGTCSTSKGSKGIMIPADGSALLNRMMRASYLEKKLKKAGGLENWLISLGLTRFVKVFQRRRVNKFQLVNLTMEKLKDMGTDAVGPRRKLMHAIDCLCQPHCFQHL